jgi:dinuclear metal center YbgI/SA1388 family protein
MAELQAIVDYCAKRLGLPEFPDFEGAMNGLQVANSGTVTRIGAAVDAGRVPFESASAKGVDFLLVHHGLFWQPPRPWIGQLYRKLKLLIDSNMAVFAAHLPLDAHAEIGNNAVLARRLRLEARRTFLPFEGRDVGLIAGAGIAREHLLRRLQSLFSQVTAIECGSGTPGEVAIVTGGGYGALPALIASGVDTLVTGELKEHCFNLAQEHALNLYACGHYATEVFGVCALAEELADRFDLPWEFIGTDNPL